MEEVEDGGVTPYDIYLDADLHPANRPFDISNKGLKDK